MDNPNASEVTYVEDYIDAVENLPDDVQRQLSRIREINVQIEKKVREVKQDLDLCKALVISVNRRAQATARMQQHLIETQELTDEKIEIQHQINDLIEKTALQLDADLRNLGRVEDQQQNDIPSVYSDNPGGSENGVSTSGGRGSSIDGAQPNASNTAEARSGTTNKRSSDCHHSDNIHSKRLKVAETEMEFCTNKSGSNEGNILS